MGAALAIRTDVAGPAGLRALARRERSPRTATRMLAIANALEGSRRAQDDPLRRLAGGHQPPQPDQELARERHDPRPGACARAPRSPTRSLRASAPIPDQELARERHDPRPGACARAPRSPTRSLRAS